EGKVAIVTGASRGIGAAIARALAGAGASVVVNYVAQAGAAAEVVASIEAAGGSALAVQADVGTAAAAKTLFDAAISRYGKVDILVNNAGLILYKPLRDTSDEEFDRIFATNVKGVFALLREAAGRLADNGRIINFSTTVTRLILPTYSVYAASKAAVEQLTRIFAKEIGSRGITVNSVSPGPTNTELFADGKSEETIKRLAAQTAFGRIGEPEEITPAVLFLASDEAAWITGQNLGANGGFA
ncbi:MAG TPA: SDR family oxidoreductase, partial [Herpetosiphonaceae bacterium]